MRVIGLAGTEIVENIARHWRGTSLTYIVITLLLYQSLIVCLRIRRWLQEYHGAVGYCFTGRTALVVHIGERRHTVCHACECIVVIGQEFNTH